MDAVRDDVRGPHPMLRLLQGDVGSGKTAVAAYALALAAGAGRPGRPAGPDRSPGPPARGHARRPPPAARDRGGAAHRLAGGPRIAPRAGGARRRARARGRGDPRPLLRPRRLRPPRPRGRGRAAPLRRGAAGRAGGEDAGWGRPRSPDDRDADPAHDRAGPLRRPGRHRPSDRSHRAAPDPDRSPPPGPPRPALDLRGARSCRGPADVRGGAAHRRGGRCCRRRARRRGRGRGGGDAPAGAPQRARPARGRGPRARARGRAGPRPPAACRSGRRDDALPGRYGRRAGRDHGHRGRRGRPGRQRHGDRGGGPLRPGPAPPAPRPGRTRQRPGMVRARQRPTAGQTSVAPRPWSAARSSRWDRSRCGCPRSPGSPTASRSRRSTSSSVARATSSATLQHGLPRLRVATLARADHRELAVAARRHAESLLLAGGGVARAGAAFAAELDRGWLRDVAAGEPATGA